MRRVTASGAARDPFVTGRDHSDTAAGERPRQRPHRVGRKVTGAVMLTKSRLIITTAFATAVLLRLWRLFPFDYGDTSVDWELVTRAVLAVGLAGSAIALVAHGITLLLTLPHSAGLPPDTEGSGLADRAEPQHPGLGAERGR